MQKNFNTALQNLTSDIKSFNLRDRLILLGLIVQGKPKTGILFYGLFLG